MLVGKQIRETHMKFIDIHTHIYVHTYKCIYIQIINQMIILSQTNFSCFLNLPSLLVMYYWVCMLQDFIIIDVCMYVILDILKYIYISRERG